MKEKKKETHTISSKIKPFISLWFPPVAWAALIFLLSSYPTKPVSKIYLKDFVVKKTAHVIEYGIFAAFLYRAFKESGVRKKKAGVYSVLIAFFYGITDEFHQSFTPGRDPKVRDIIFDTIGAGLAIYAIWNLLPKAPKKLRIWAKSLRLI